LWSWSQGIDGGGGRIAVEAGAHARAQLVEGCRAQLRHARTTDRQLGSDVGHAPPVEERADDDPARAGGQLPDGVVQATDHLVVQDEFLRSGCVIAQEIGHRLRGELLQAHGGGQAHLVGGGFHLGDRDVQIRGEFGGARCPPEQGAQLFLGGVHPPEALPGRTGGTIECA